MALDGAFLRHIKQELERSALDAKVEKIYQPNREEMVLALRTRTDSFKLLISARANSARIHFTRFLPENPKVPPMLCMLLRKRLAGARLVGVRQPGLERMLYLDFDATNELGDKVKLSLAVEIMGRYSNIIFLDEEGKIIDALKRVDAEMSSERLVLPGFTYRLPPPQEKLCLLEAPVEDVMERLAAVPSDLQLSKALLNSLQGLSPIVCRELQYLTGRGQEITVQEMTEEQKGRLRFFLERTRETILNTCGKPHMVTNLNQKPLDFSFMNIGQYGTAAVVSAKESFSALLDDFYSERDSIERMRAKSQDLLRVLSNATDRLNRKIAHQQVELEQCAHRDTLREYADLINANVYQLEKGTGPDTFAECAEIL